MLGPLLALTLLGSTPTPRSAVIVPHAQSLAEARAFLTSASLYAPSLTPGWDRVPYVWMTPSGPTSTKANDTISYK